MLFNVVYWFINIQVFFLLYIRGLFGLSNKGSYHNYCSYSETLSNETLHNFLTYIASLLQI